MATLKHFLKKHGETPFSLLPFCEADLLALVSLSYADYKATSYFDDDSEKGFINFSLFGKASMINTLGNKYVTLGSSYITFLKLILAAPRYSSLKIGYFKDYFSEEKTIQFFALTYELNDEIIVCFRGTDNTISGWKEDFNMAVMDKVPSQKKSKDYLQAILSKIKRKKVIVMGHSKGGNLAYYAFLNLPEIQKKRVKAVYNFDGPGFINDKYNYDKYSDKLHKFIPEDGVIGCLLDNTNRHEIVQSTRINVAGHDCLTWCLDKKTNLSTLKRMDVHTPFFYAFSNTINQWVHENDRKYLKVMVDFVFKFVDTNNIFTLKALFIDIIFKSDDYLQMVKDYDDENKEKIKKICRNFVDLYVKNFLKDRVELEDHIFK